MRLKDLTGQKFGRLTVIERAPNKKNHTYWRCCCECGNITEVASNRLMGGQKSCGCLTVENTIRRNKQNAKHGMYKNRFYNIWSLIKSRCFNPNDKDYPRYGGRGITIFSVWANDFQAFYEYISQLEHFNEKGYTLDRINNNGNYEPSNLHFANAKGQARNRRSSVFVDYKGRTITLAEVAEKSGINYATLFDRYQRGDTGERLFRPVKK